MTSYLAEFFGTALFAFLGLSASAAVKLNLSYFKNAGALFELLAWGLAYSLSAFCFYRLSGANFNPIISLALATAGFLNWIVVPGYILAQLLGAFLGACLMYLFYKDQFDATEDSATIRSAFCSDCAIANMGLNLFCEIILGVIFSFFMLTFISVYSYGFYYGIIFITVAMALGGTTDFALNPAIDLSGRIAHQILPIHNKKNSNWSYSLVPIVGPIIGCFIGAGLAGLLTSLEILI